MILLDDNFASIVTGVEEGRLIFDNLRRVLPTPSHLTSLRSHLSFSLSWQMSLFHLELSPSSVSILVLTWSQLSPWLTSRQKATSRSVNQGTPSQTNLSM